MLETLKKMMKSLQFRFDLYYDLYPGAWRYLLSYASYVFLRVIGFSNNRIEKNIEICELLTQSYSSYNVSNSLNLRLEKEVSPFDLAKACFELHGVYPISFVLMRESYVQNNSEPKGQLISKVIPGKPYSFSEENQLYEEYRNSDFAFTFRKCGWDSYRNLEILFQRCFPLYLDAKKIPRFCMTFYPKNQIQRVTESFLASPFSLSKDFKENFFSTALKQLDSRFLGEYLLSCVGFLPKKILFYDENLDIFRGDYQSMMTLKALFQIPDVEVTIVQELEYLFSRQYDQDDLYGRGFGYRGLLDGVKVRREANFNIQLLDYFDWVVVGSAARNMNFIQSLDSRLSDKTLMIWGEDRPPTRKELHILRSKSKHCFVRELTHPFVVP